MREVTPSLLKALRRELGGVAIVWCNDLDARAYWLNEVANLADAPILRTELFSEALLHPDKLVLLTPLDEAATVYEMDGGRDAERTQPIVLFLIRGGVGQTALAHSPSLASLVRGRDVDPDALAEIDWEKEVQRFQQQHNKTPTAWLEDWRAEKLPTTSENIRVYYQALLLEL